MAKEEGKCYFNRSRAKDDFELPQLFVLGMTQRLFDVDMKKVATGALSCSS